MIRALLDATGEALAVGDFDEALRRIDDAAGLGIAWTESEIATRRREIDDARERRGPAGVSRRW